MIFLPAPLFGETLPGNSQGQSSFEPDLNIVEITISGLERTNRVWLDSYLGLSLPERMNRLDIIRLQRKILTTGAFTDVKVAVEPVSDRLDAFRLWFQVEEKWTTIPVLRGVYGGGTPLRVLGLYDIHSFGRLLTFGGELRKYGDAPPGFVLYGRDPRNNGGRNYLGAEFWRDFRRREIYDGEGEPTGTLATDASLVRLKFHRPFTSDYSPRAEISWRYGLDLETLAEKPSSFDKSYQYDGSEILPTNLGDLSTANRQNRVMATLVFDNVEINQIEYDGFRAKFRAGPNFSENTTHSLAELDAYYYWMSPLSLNLASHLFVGQASRVTPATQYFLGGLDSVRGIPDGVVYGNRAGYLNVELRKVIYRARYAWFQPAAFVDVGNAVQDWTDFTDDVRTSVGAGVRISIPQVYRMIFRIDYAVSLDGSGNRGITAGMNQFFDPYRPL